MDRLLPVAGGLELEEVGVLAVVQHQLVVRALLDQLAVLEDEDPVCHPRR